MPTHEQLAVYANILLTKGLNLQKGQILVINAPVESSAFVTILTKEAYTCGASQVVCNWRCDDTTRLRYEYESQEQFETFPDWRREFSLSYYRQNAAFLSLISANPYLMSGMTRRRSLPGRKRRMKP